jgi:hypothetical protein
LLTAGLVSSGFSAFVLLTPRVVQSQVYSTPMRDVDNPARQPISFQPPIISVMAGAENGFAYGAYQVPPGKRLIISYIVCSEGIPTGKVPFAIYLSALGLSGQTSIATAPFTIGGAFVDVPNLRQATVSQAVYMFGNPGDQINVGVLTDGGPSSASFSNIAVNGYLVNLP